MNDMEMGHLEVLQRGVYSLLVAVTQFFVFTAPESLKSVSQAAPHKFTSYGALGKAEWLLLHYLHQSD